MYAGLSCPRCATELSPPDDWARSWSCPVHGEVAPVHPPVRASYYTLRSAAGRCHVPLWMPWPLPAGWTFSGLRLAGEERSGAVAGVVALTGPDPLPEADPLSRIGHVEADLLLVAEQPGVGLGAHLAGLTDLDAGSRLLESSASRVADLKLVAAGHDTPLWTVETGSGCAAYVGEAAGVWLWVLLWPVHAAAVLLEEFELIDTRDPGLRLDLPYGPPSLRLGPPPTA